MKKSEIAFIPNLNDYILSVSLGEHKTLKALRETTNKHPNSILQIPPEQGQFMTFLLKILNAKKVIDIGTYTGYSALCMGLALPKDGKLVTCDINSDWADIGKPYWKEAGMEKIIDLRIAPALETLSELIATNESNTYDFIFIDADKINYDNYYEKALKLIKPEGLIAIDNVLLFGAVLNPNYLSSHLQNVLSNDAIESVKKLNLKLRNDKRVDISMLQIADGLTLVRKKSIGNTGNYYTNQ
jgi:predicted O-methyltransferase YrrM